MNNIDPVFEKTYDANGKPGLFSLLEILQEAAGAHASKLGFGFEHSREKGFFWVLVRQELQIAHWPKENEPITIKTWTQPLFGIHAIREFELLINEQKIGDCSTTWVILDSETRKPKRIENTGNLFKPRIDYSIGFSAEKIVPPRSMDSLRTFQVSTSDLDRNNHVNNIKYAQWMLDSIPTSHLQNLKIKTYKINFLAEAFLADQIEILSNIGESQDAENEIYFMGQRLTDSKVVFVASILMESA